MAMDKIALKLDEDGVSTRFVKKHWSPTTISQVLKNQAYWSGKLTANCIKKPVNGSRMIVPC